MFVDQDENDLRFGVFFASEAFADWGHNDMSSVFGFLFVFDVSLNGVWYALFYAL